MNTNIEQQLSVLKDEAILRGKAINQHRKTLISNYDSLVLTNGLDELRDVNIFILDCSYRNRHLISLINEVLTSNNKAMDKFDYNTLVIENLSCIKEIESLETAMNSIRISKRDMKINSIQANAVTELRNFPLA
tara:strand:+ start:41152 stop:41553 length:402 start_codon:yes stop_codon:yes gene_type:complete